MDCRTGVPFARLENEGIPAGQSNRKHPHRNHSREVERGDSNYGSQRLTKRETIDTRPHLVRVFAFEELRDTAGEFHTFEGTHQLTCCIWNSFAVFGRNDPHQAALFSFNQLFEPKKNPGTPWRGNGTPGRKLCVCCAYGGVHFLFRSKRDKSRHLAGRRFITWCSSVSLSGNRFTADPMRNNCAFEGWDFAGQKRGNRRAHKKK